MDSKSISTCKLLELLGKRQDAKIFLKKEKADLNKWLQREKGTRFLAIFEFQRNIDSFFTIIISV